MNNHIYTHHHWLKGYDHHAAILLSLRPKRRSVINLLLVWLKDIRIKLHLKRQCLVKN